MENIALRCGQLGSLGALISWTQGGRSIGTSINLKGYTERK